jgi:hypothetical protein
VSNIAESIKNLAVDIETLKPLPGNPRKGNVDAIMASYSEFGQMRPIVVRPDNDGTATVIAGNHQLEAAKRLGWKEIAAVQFEADDQRAIAFALADNRTNELGHTDNDLLQDMLEQITDSYEGLLDGLGWDEFELAAIEESSLHFNTMTEPGYVAPVMRPDAMEQIEAAPIRIETTSEGSRIVAPEKSDTNSLVTQGSTSANASGSRNAVVQYTLVFDDAEQQSEWYQFVRWLRSEPSIVGDTTAQRLLDFMRAHASY